MATIYRKMYPMPMPAGAEIIIRRGQSLAQWVDGNGNVKTAPLAAAVETLPSIGLVQRETGQRLATGT